jgi:hypothetical protein
VGAAAGGDAAAGRLRPIKYDFLDTLQFMLQLLKCLQLSKQQYAWAPTVQALSQPVLLQLLPHMQQYSKQQHAEIQARPASSSRSVDSKMADENDRLLQTLLLELARGGTLLAVRAALH